MVDLGQKRWIYSTFFIAKIRGGEHTKNDQKSQKFIVE